MFNRSVFEKSASAIALICALAAFSAPAAAVPFNVAGGKTVSITGEVGVITADGVTAGFGDATAFPPAPLSSIVDGVYLGGCMSRKQQVVPPLERVLAGHRPAAAPVTRDASSRRPDGRP